MPPRWLSILIVAAWLLVSGRLFVRDLLPRLLPGEPPPFTIDLVEEARLRRVWTDWTVERDGKPLLKARSRVLNPGYDAFELAAEYTPQRRGEAVSMHGMLVRRMASSYRVSGAGDLLGVSVELDGTPQLIRWDRAVYRIDIEGAVRDATLRPTLRVSRGPDQLLSRDLPAVRVRQGGAVLLPLHPANRLQGLRRGQAWTTAALDPLGDSISAIGGGVGETQLLRARVRDELVPYTHKWRKEIPCLVIDYDGPDLRASTWVEERSGLVLCQEAAVGQEIWVMYRE